jgi:hypothetical protein
MLLLLHSLLLLRVIYNTTIEEDQQQAPSLGPSRRTKGQNKIVCTKNQQGVRAFPYAQQPAWHNFSFAFGML